MQAGVNPPTGPFRLSEAGGEDCGGKWEVGGGAAVGKKTSVFPY